MAHKNPWTTLEVEPVKYVMIIHEGVVTWHYRPAGNVVKKPPSLAGGGEYATLSASEKLYKRAKRRINKYSLALLSTEKLPDWLITLIYPHGQARSLTAEQIKADLQYLRKFIARKFPDAGVSYSIDWAARAKFHVHMLVWGIKPKPGTDAKRNAVKVAVPFRKWWSKRVNSKRRRLLDVKYLHTKKDSICARNYLIGPKKVKAHMPVVALMGRKNSFGFFNKKNIPFLPGEVMEVSPEEFEKVRQLLLADLAKNPRNKKEAQAERHKRKLKERKCHRHRFHDPELGRRLRAALRPDNGGV